MRFEAAHPLPIARKPLAHACPLQVYVRKAATVSVISQAPAKPAMSSTAELKKAPPEKSRPANFF